MDASVIGAPGTVPGGRAGRAWLAPGNLCPQLVQYGVTLVVALLVLLPLVMLIYGSLRTAPPGAPGTLTFEHYGNLLTPQVADALWNTLILAIAVSLGCMGFGTLLAWLIFRTTMPGRMPLAVLIAASFYFPSFLSAEAWALLAAPRSGALNVLIRSFWPDFVGINIYSLAGMIWVMTLAYVPYVFLFLAAPLRSLDPTLEEASLVAGAGMRRTVRAITLPLVSYAILAGALITFVQAAGLFGVPAVLGLQARIWVLATRIYNSITYYPPDFSGAAALSMVLLALTICGVFAQRQITGRVLYTAITGRGYRPRLVDLGPWRWVGLAACLAYLGLGLVLPLLALLYASLVPYYDGRIDLSQLTLANYRDVLFVYPVTWRAFKNSFVLSAGGATVGVALAALVSYVVLKSRTAGRGLLDFLAMSPAAFPGMVIAVGLLWAYITTPLYATVWLLMVSYVTHYLPHAVRTTSSNLVQLDDALEESARVAGASWWRGLSDVVLPLIRPAMLSAWLLLFVAFFRELSSAVLLYTHGNEVVSVVIWDLHQNGNLGYVSALAIIALALIYAIFALAYRLFGLTTAEER